MRTPEVQTPPRQTGGQSHLKLPQVKLVRRENVNDAEMMVTIVCEGSPFGDTNGHSDGPSDPGKNDPQCSAHNCAVVMVRPLVEARDDHINQPALLLWRELIALPVW